MKLPLETNPNKFLDTEFIHTDQEVKTQGYNKDIILFLYNLSYVIPPLSNQVTCLFS